MKKIIFMFVLIFAMVSCTNQPVNQKSNLTTGMIKAKVVEGKTSQTEILEIFGAPNLITTNSEGNEVWTYNKSSYDAKSASKEFGWGLGIIGGGKSSAVSSASTGSLDFIITFSKSGIVEKYKVIQASY